MPATREQILSANDSRHKDIDVPGWGNVRIRSFTAAESLRFIEWVRQEEPTNEQAVDLFVELIIMGVIGDNGGSLFTKEDTETLKQRDFGTLQHVGNAILEFNSMAKSSIEDKAKN